MSAFAGFKSVLAGHDMRLHDFVVTSDKAAAEIITMAYNAPTAKLLTGEIFDISPGQAQQVFNEACKAVVEAA